MLIKAVVSCADAPMAGEIGEVDDEYGAFLIQHGKALSAESLAVRQGVDPGPYADLKSPALTKALEKRDLPSGGTMVQKRARLEADDLAPPKQPKPKSKSKTTTTDGGQSG